MELTLPLTNRRIRAASFAGYATALFAVLYLPVAAAIASTPMRAGFRDQTYSSSTGGDNRATGEKPESKLWFNDGLWWACMWSTSASSFRIFRFDTASESWIDTGTSVDNRLRTKADALWDGAKLYIVSHRYVSSGSTASSADRGKLFRYSYNTSTKAYSLDSQFPVEVNNATSETLVLAKAANGMLWVTWTQSQRVMVNHSVGGNDAQWSTPLVLPVSNAADLTTDDISSIVAYDNFVGVLWSNETDKKMYFSRHTDNASDTQWTPTIVAYGRSSDDHINLKSLRNDSAGKIFGVIKTGSSANLIPLIRCANTSSGCTSTSDWSSTLAYNSDAFAPTRPILLVDTAKRRLYLFSSNVDPADGSEGIYFKRTSLDSPSFSASANGTLFMRNTSTDQINDPTSTKQNLDSSTNLVVLGSDRGARAYMHNRLALDSPTLITFSPVSGAAGTPVTLTGNNFTGATAVRLNGRPADFSVISDSTISAAVPTGASSGQLSVTGVGGSSTSATSFTVTGSGGGGTVAFQDVKIGASLNSTKVATAVSVTAASNHLYLAAVAAKSNTSVVSVSGLGLSWTQVIAQCAGRGQTGVSVWKAQGTPSVSGVVTATFSSTPSAAVIAVSRYSGVTSGTPIGAFTSANSRGVHGSCSGGTDTASYSLTLQTTSPNAFVYSAVAMRQRDHTPGSGFTERSEIHVGSSGSVASVAVSDKPVASPSAATVNGTFDATVDWAVATVEIQ